MTSIILASSSPYRKELLKRLQIKFETKSPDIDESKLRNENGYDASKRLARQKAISISKEYPNAYIIGCDQTAIFKKNHIEKSKDILSAANQLKVLSGNKVNFYSALCLYHYNKNVCLEDVVEFDVKYRKLTSKDIQSYLKKENALNCVGGIKSEGLGISLLSEINSTDPTSIIGLPLISLSKMLASCKIAPND